MFCPTSTPPRRRRFTGVATIGKYDPKLVPMVIAQNAIGPRQQVTRETQHDGQEEQHDPDHPVELARRLVGAVVEDPHHVQEHEEDHQVGAPPVDVAGQEPERDLALDVEDVRVCERGRGT